MPDRYPIPLISDAQPISSGCKVFLVIDLKSGYNKIPMNSKDIGKTAVFTQLGLFEWSKMPFGLMNSGFTFQGVVHSVLSDLPFVFCYINYFLLASCDAEEHKLHLHLSFAWLWTHHLTINLEKCVLGCSTVTFLSHTADSMGFRPPPWPAWLLSESSRHLCQNLTSNACWG